MSEENIFDGQIHHPFRCLVAGPSQSGKSTFVRDLMLRQGDIIDVKFDYITIVLGTEENKNEILSSMRKRFPPGVVEIIELMKSYSSPEEMKSQFPLEFEKYLKKKSALNKKGCVVFDDLMSELAECGLLVSLFTRFSSHYSISTIHITQNVFFKSGGKHGSDNVTIYRNTHVLVLFKNPMDNTIMATIAKRMNASKYADLIKLLNHIVDKHRYVVIHGDFNRPDRLKYSSDIFRTHPIPHQTIYELVTPAKKGD